MRLIGIAVQPFRFAVPSQETHRDAQVVDEIRHGQRFGAEHLAADVDRLPLQLLGLGMLVQFSKQDRVVVEDRDRVRVPAVLHGRPHRQRLLVGLPGAVELVALPVIGSE